MPTFSNSAVGTNQIRIEATDTKMPLPVLTRSGCFPVRRVVKIQSKFSRFHCYPPHITHVSCSVSCTTLIKQSTHSFICLFHVQNTVCSLNIPLSTCFDCFDPLPSILFLFNAERHALFMHWIAATQEKQSTFKVTVIASTS
jgi:hypothetical protein